MIRNDQELAVTREQISRLEDLLAQLRVTAKPYEFPAVASGYRTEIERMYQEVLNYLSRHSSEAAVAT